jgi:hypothetical protein
MISWDQIITAAVNGAFWGIGNGLVMFFIVRHLEKIWEWRKDNGIQPKNKQPSRRA